MVGSQNSGGGRARCGAARIHIYSRHGKLGDREVVALLAQKDHHQPTIKATANMRQIGTTTTETMDLGPGRAGGETARMNGAEQGFDESLIWVHVKAKFGQ